MSKIDMEMQDSWRTLRDIFLIALGAFGQALGLRLFLVPARLASGGVSGLAQVLNHFTNWPIGVMVLIGNLPLFILGWRYLGGRDFAWRTAFAVVVFSTITDLLVYYVPAHGVTDDILLNTLYGGVLSGVGYGLVYLGRGTSGGSDILARILNSWRGVPISQSYLLVDSAVILAAGLAFGWERALYALVVLYISGLAAEASAEGSKMVRTALIITTRPQGVSEEILRKMGRGVTQISARGGFTGARRTVLYCVISRAEVTTLKRIVRAADPQAFMVIGHAHEALGEGFQELVG